MRSKLLVSISLLTLLCIVTSSAQTGSPATGSVLSLAPGFDRIIAPGEQPEILAEGFDWSEGPLWLPDMETLIFSDIPKNSIYSWNEKKGLQLYLKPSGYTGPLPRGGESGSNGLLLDAEGRLVLCQHGDRRMAVMNSKRKKPEANFTTLADRWQGKRFNSPNDAVFKKNGDLYFTDPAYGMEHGYNDKNREMDFTGIFRLRPDGALSLLADDLSAPNGIAFSPDESRMYVANSGGSTGPLWMVYDLAEDGTFANAKVFYNPIAARDSLTGAPDGLVVRQDGIIFATGPGGVWVFNPDGEPLGIVKTGQATSNCTLDTDGRYLYITADMYLMRIRLL